MPLCELDWGKRMERMKNFFLYVFSIVIIPALILSCSTPSFYLQKEPVTGVYHSVKKGETLWSIARAYNVNLQDLAEANNINNSGSLEEGSALFIPEAKGVIDDVAASVKATDTEDKTTSSPAKIKQSIESYNEKNVKNDTGTSKKPDQKNLPPAVKPEKTKHAKLAPREGEMPTELPPAAKPGGEKLERKPKARSAPEEKEEIQFEKRRFIWPVRGTVKTHFGIQPNKTYHNWIKIVSTAGTQVKASASGIVIYSSQLKDYGETVIVRHEENFATVYTHLRKRYVKTDQNVKKGDVIALIGETDENGNAYMNFEVRLNGKARNPLFFLP